ncbi:MAG: peptidoglycan recognition family protein [Tepidiformaceae bacterium]
MEGGKSGKEGEEVIYPNYPAAEQVPWKLDSPDGQQCYWPGINAPTAVVLHVMQGYATTAREWANDGHYGASWHFTIGRDGSVMQHLGIGDSGYHAGILPGAPKPTWPLWRGDGQNVNWYTVGVEHEGFEGTPFTEEQTVASIALCKWLAGLLPIPFDRDHFPPHADIDVVNRVNDFNTPALREAHYARLFAPEEEDMTPEQTQSLIDASITKLLDDGIAPLFRTLTAAYWNPTRPGGYSDPNGAPVPPDPEVVHGIAVRLPPVFSPTAPHSHDIAAFSTGPTKEGAQ